MTTAPASTIAVPPEALKELNFAGSYMANYTDLIADLLTRIAVGINPQHHDNVMSIGYLLTDLKAAANTVQETTAPLLTAEPSATAETPEADDQTEEPLDIITGWIPGVIALLQSASFQLSANSNPPVKHPVAHLLVLDALSKMERLHSYLTR